MARRKSVKSLKVLLLFDLSVDISRDEYPEYLKTEEWKDDAYLVNTLRKLGHDVRLLGLHKDIQPLIDEVRDNPPDVVFNGAEAFADNRELEPNVVSLLELLGVPYTGSEPEALQLCKDKGLTKKILTYHKIPVPKFQISRRSFPVRSLKRFPFPAFIKPLRLEASEGISQLSFADTEKDALDRVRFIHENLKVDAIIEEYIEGRELYVSVLGNERLTVFPPRELFFDNMPDDGPRFATFKAKWDQAYRERWGIESYEHDPLEPQTLKRMYEICRKVYRLLKLRGYGRIDLRLKENGQIYILEANPNPNIAWEDEFALSASEGKVKYPELIDRILRLALTSNNHR